MVTGNSRWTLKFYFCKAENKATELAEAAHFLLARADIS